jgi:hypothetical protein
MNNIIRNLTIQNYQNFKNSFESTKEVFWDEEKGKLRHPGEFGSYRESLAKKWLGAYTPERYGISSGFIITDKGSISTQCDLIIYDKAKTPKIENVDNQRFFPIETVAGVGEIKSDINSISELNNHLRKLSLIKKLRDDVTVRLPYYRNLQKDPYDPELIPFDNIFTFLICNKFKFSFSSDKLDYGDILHKHKHNIVLSLNDGILNYTRHDGKSNFYAPFKDQNVYTHHFLKMDDSELPMAIMSFISSYTSLLTLTTLLETDMTLYLTDHTYPSR